MNNLLKDRFAEVELLAKGAGLDPYDIAYFEVPASIIYEVASYGLPTRYSHWTFGRLFESQRRAGEMGHSKIYELILNNANPCYAFLDNTNTDTINLLICAHCLGHADQFKNNALFVRCGEKDMVDTAKKHAEMIDSFRRDYGDEEVDYWLDTALALERHIDAYKGVYRDRYPKRHVEYNERVPKEWEDIAAVHTKSGVKPLVNKVIKGIYLPPHTERDILWFLTQYSNLESWQQTIFSIVRRESYYFFPQFKCKILSEGWASIWHAELMRQYFLGNKNEYGVTGIDHPLTSEEHLDFVSAHEKVVQPGPRIPLKQTIAERDPTGRPTGKKVKVWSHHIVENPNLFNAATRINPYYLGFKLFRDIKKRWDKYSEQGWMENEFGDKVPVMMNGDQKIRQVMMEEDDISFLRKYLTEDLCDELHLFAYGSTSDYEDDYVTQEEIEDRDHELHELHGDLGEEEIDEAIINNRTIAVRTKDVKDIIAAFAKSHSNYGVPSIVVRRVDENGLLRLEHLPEDNVNMDIKYGKEVLKYIYRAWGRPVEMIRKSTDCTYILRYNGYEAEVDHLDPDYPDNIEKNAQPSSW